MCVCECVHDCRTQWNRNMCMAEVLCAECYAPIRSSPATPLAALQMRLSLLILLAVELQIVCVWRQSFCVFFVFAFFSFQFLFILQLFILPDKMSTHLSRRQQHQQQLPICSSSFCRYELKCVWFFICILFLATLLPPPHLLDFPFYLICLTARFAQQIRAYSKYHITHFSARFKSLRADRKQLAPSLTVSARINNGEHPAH